MDDATNDLPTPSAASPFERIRQLAEDDSEYWSARDLAEVLGYRQWRNFKEPIERAIVACSNSGHDPADHFAEIRKMVQIGSGARRSIPDYHLSRYACYLLIQNADPNKEIVALGQTYFAVQTRRQELADEQLADMSEDRKRLVLRDEMTTHNRNLAATAQQAGVVQPRDFAVFQDHGYMGLYGGLKAKDIHRRKELKSNQHILDHMGSTELAANLFRATQTEEKIRREGITGKDRANKTHFEVGQKVRQTIEELGGSMPEDQPTPEESVQQIRTRAAKELTSTSPQLPLFGEEPAEPDEAP